MINTVCGRSSTGRIITGIARDLYRRGDDCLCLYGRFNAPDNVKSIKCGGSVSLYSHILLTRVFDRQGLGSISATRRMIKVIKEYDPDIIHLHNLHGYYLNVKLLFEFLSSCGKPIVWTIHDCWPFTGHCVHYTQIRCYKWRTAECGDCPKKREYPASFICDHSAKNIKQKKALFTSTHDMQITTVSDWLAGQVRQSFLRDYPVARVYNGIDISTFKPLKSSARSDLGIGDKFMILCVQDGWSERKGLGTIKQTAALCALDEVIVMVGVQDKIKNRLPANIIALPRTDSVETLVKLYTAADVLLNPSVEETFGLVTVEALACGTPSIVLNSTACPELVDETCGRVVENLPDRLISAIHDLRDHMPSVEECIRHAEQFSSERSNAGYLEIYDQMIRKYKDDNR